MILPGALQLMMPPPSMGLRLTGYNPIDQLGFNPRPGIPNSSDMQHPPQVTPFDSGHMEKPAPKLIKMDGQGNFSSTFSPGPPFNTGPPDIAPHGFRSSDSEQSSDVQSSEDPGRRRNEIPRLLSDIPSLLSDYRRDNRLLAHQDDRPSFNDDDRPPFHGDDRPPFRRDGRPPMCNNERQRGRHYDRPPVHHDDRPFMRRDMRSPSRYDEPFAPRDIRPGDRRHPSHEDIDRQFNPHDEDRDEAGEETIRHRRRSDLRGARPWDDPGFFPRRRGGFGGDDRFNRGRGGFRGFRARGGGGGDNRGNNERHFVNRDHRGIWAGRDKSSWSSRNDSWNEGGEDGNDWEGENDEEYLDEPEKEANVTDSGDNLRNSGGASGANEVRKETGGDTRVVVSESVSSKSAVENV